jgi:glutamate-1-semialdehyde 2,1-aminomutase
MSALRAARGFTGHNLAVKFIGCYHGHVDSLLVKAGSGVATLGITDSAGVPRAFADTTIPLPFNSIDALEQCFARHGGNIACVIVEPVVGNMGCVPPAAGFLQALREITARHGALLIFDEVMTGFRLALGGAQQLYGVTPDLTTLGKVIGGGLPVGAYGGRLDVMRKVAPLGPVYQAGTLSGNPLATAAGLATLAQLDGAAYSRLGETTARLATGMQGEGVQVPSVTGLLTVFFSRDPVDDYAAAQATDHAAFRVFWAAMLERGIYLPPSPYEAWFPSLAHTEEQIDRTIAAAAESFEAAGVR